ncbi:MAG: hypothetical protein IJW63_09305 [Lachnospiraceae bacterium]|nr:hypothetical protein [Lachnospiraceae bacterium]
MKSKKDPISFLNMGTSSLLVIFLVLSIAIFATLALSSAKNDIDFSRQLSQQKQAYYEVCNQSEVVLAHLDAILAKHASNSQNVQEYFDKTLSSLDNEIENVTIESQVAEDHLTLSWQLPFSETRMLSVVIEIPSTANMDTDHYYQIIAWQTVTFDESER